MNVTMIAMMDSEEINPDDDAMYQTWFVRHNLHPSKCT